MEGATRHPLNGQSTSPDVQPEEDIGLRTKTEKWKKMQQLIQTLILYIGFFSLGLGFSIVGPTLLDLQRNTRTSTEAISMVFTASSIGGLCGAVLAGFIVHRLNHWVLLSIAMSIIGPLHILRPYMDHIGFLLAIFGVSGAAGSFFDAAGNMVLLRVWGEDNGPWMQALHFIFGSGALIGPLLAEPFLRSRDGTIDVLSVGNATFSPVESSVFYDEESSGPLRVFPNGTLGPFSENISIVILSNTQKQSAGEEYESKVHWAYLVVGLTAILASALFLAIAFFCSEIELQCLNKRKKKKNAEDKKKEEDEPENKAFRLQIISVVFFFYLFYCVLELNYGNYLTVFAVKGLGWSEKEGARVTAAYWATFTAGRGLGIILVKVLPPWVLLTGDLVISVVSLFILTFFSHYHYMVLWVCTLTLGFGISTIYATGLTWTEQYIHITGVAGAMFTIAAAGGEMFGPILIGALFASVGPRSFLYVMCSAVCLLVLLFIVMQFISRRHRKRKHQEPTSESKSLQENFAM